MHPAKLLIVEGSDDKRFVLNLLRRAKLDFGEEFVVQQSNGIGKLFRDFKLALKSGNYAAVGAVIDADIDLPEYWKKIGKTLRQSGCQHVPAKPHPDGTIIEAAPRHPKVAIWLMPDNRAEGGLEEFICALVPERDPLWAKAEVLVDELMADGQQRFKPQHRVKAVLHTWLAWQEKPGLALSQALNYKYLKTEDHLLDTSAAKGFLKWMERAFG